mmetsp:Transcript_4297/g.12971  ORF Transcript_4297/g.12971 Transcript_4297/m.12971 type:complete len:338 (+) Transcript_4297:42-1055(+)
MTSKRMRVGSNAISIADRSDGQRFAITSAESLTILDADLNVVAQAGLNSVPSGVSYLEKDGDKDLLLLGATGARVEVRPARSPALLVTVLQHPSALREFNVAAAPGRWPLSTRVRVVTASRKMHGLVTTTVNRQLYVWQLDGLPGSVTQEATAVYSFSREPIISVDWHPSEPMQLAVADAASAVHMVDLRAAKNNGSSENGVSSVEMAHSGACVRKVCWLPSSPTSFASVGDDGVIRMWDCRKMSPIQETRAHTGPATCVHAGTDFVVSGGADGVIKLWGLTLDQSEPRVSSQKLMSIDMYPSGGPRDSVNGLILRDLHLCAMSSDGHLLRESLSLA